jgi:hypothetical protein
MYNSRVKIAALAISLVALSCNAPSGQEIEGLALTLTALVNTATASPPGATLAPSAPAPGGSTAPLAGCRASSPPT